jgi:hypothetical protein
MQINTKKHGRLSIIGDPIELEQLLYSMGFFEFIDKMCSQGLVRKNGQTLQKF